MLFRSSRGAIATDGTHTFEAVPPRIEALSPIGAGDAMAAAFVWAQSRKSDFIDSVRWAVAEGTATTQLPGMEFATLDQAKQIYKSVEVREV